MIRTACLAAAIACAGGASVAEAAPKSMRVGANAPAGSVWDKQWDRSKAAIAQYGDLIAPEFYIHGELGASETVLSAARRNRVQMFAGSVWTLATQVPDFAVLSLPYLFDSAAEADFVYDCCLDTLVAPLLADAGLVGLGFSEGGWSGFYARTPIRSPDDVRGRKIRAAETPAVIAFLRALGADIVFMPMGEVLPALQTGLIEGGFGPPTWQFTASRVEAPHYTLTRHSYETGLFTVNADWWASLTDAERDAVRSVVPAFKAQRDEVRIHDVELIARMAAMGDDVHPPSSDELERWMAAGRSVHRTVVESLSPRARAIYDGIQSAKRDYRLARESGDSAGRAQP